MVYITRQLLGVSKGFSKKAKFIDRVRIYTKAGRGGQGYPKYGGLGGDGGSVVMVAEPGVSLYNFVNENPERRFLAQNGTDARRLVMMGQQGEDLVVKVPPGVAITTDDGREIANLNKAGDKFVVSKGGDGGGPHNDFKADKGVAQSIRIDLKLLADVGLVGFPNAGKSTLLSSISRAKPKIADYPFTTIRPQLGVVTYADNRRISIADLPGLIEGAHMNVGMGHFFLKHLERTKVLLMVVDVHGFQLKLGSHYRDAFETTVLLNKELEMYKPSLLDKPQILLINKMDSDESDEKYEKTLHQLNNMKDYLHTIPEKLRPSRLVDFKSIIPISAVLEQNIDNVKQTVRDVIESEFTEDRETIQEKLQNHLSFHNEEAAVSKLT